jgi:tetratricopeptide (TPR) repeat protein/tRNA A-37 threonylcarbamoyl transferase component Bud32
MTDGGRHRRLGSLFAHALDLTGPAREAFLFDACAGDEELLRDVRSLLAMDAQLGDVTARRVAPGLLEVLSTRAQIASWSGLRVGPFEMREELGRGGMGVVYRAERVDGTVAQQVAIKFVRRDALDANTRRRFELERQLLASLDHPHIARLIDAAELEDGTPYYVMEYVAGEPITTYCDRVSLDLRGRVALLRKVCGAVAEAHRRLIVHRDLKPSNILITADGVPKLLDFGIAKTLSADGAFAQDETGTAFRYFSPQYAAPEQLTGGAIGVACDVYALGLLAFELLAGARPFELAGLTPAQIDRLIAQTPPPAPSAVRARASRAAGKALRGDLDGIVLMCLRKDPHERYPSVEQLEADFGNYLEGLPVKARGGHGVYRLQKFVRRNQAAVAAGVLVVLALVVGAAAFAWQAREAERRAAELDAVARFQAEMLTNVDPTNSGRFLSATVRAKLDAALAKRRVPDDERAARRATFDALWSDVNATDTARELIDHTILAPAVAAIDARFAEQPLAAAALRQGLATSYYRMNWYDRAEPLQQSALALRRAHLGDLHVDTAHSLYRAALLYNDLGRQDDAERHYEAAIAVQRALLGTRHPDTLTTMMGYSSVLMNRERYAEADALLREILPASRAVLGDNADLTLNIVNNLGWLLRATGRFAEAEPYMRESLERRRRHFGHDAVETLIAANNLALVLGSLDRLDEAERLHRETLERRRRVLGEEDPDTLVSLMNVGAVLRRQGRLEEAAALLVEAEGKTRRLLGAEHPNALRAAYNLAELRLEQGLWAEAERLHRDTYETRLRVLGPAHSDTLNALTGVSLALLGQRRFAEAGAMVEPAEAAGRAGLAAQPSRLVSFLVALGRIRAARGDHVAAEQALMEARTLATAPAQQAMVFAALADFHAARHAAEPDRGHDATAQRWAREAERQRAAPPPR